MTGEARCRYLFSPLERGGVLLGLVPSQLLAIAAGGLLAVVVVHASPDAFGILGGLFAAGGGAALALLPLAGRPPVSWLPIVAPWLRRRRTGTARNPAPAAGTTFRYPDHPLAGERPAASPVPLKAAGPGKRRGARPPAASAAWGSAARGPAPWAETDGSRSLAGGVEIVAAPATPGQAELGVARDRLGGTWCAAVPVRGGAFALADPADKERSLASWGSILSGLARAGSPVHRVQWVERTFTGDGMALRRYLDQEQLEPDSSNGYLPNSRQVARSAYEELIGAAGAAGIEHECLVVLAVHPRRVPRSQRSFGRGEGAMIGLLRREIRLLQGQLRSAGLVAGDPLGPASLTAALRVGFEPRARGRDALGPGGAWPLASTEGWASIRTDGAWHATYWVAEWPRVEVGADFLAPLLLGDTCRTVSVTFAPVPAERARRQAESARTAGAADEELRRRAGFLPTARRSREAEGVAQREAELADGHAELRFSGYVTVSGADPGALDAACAEIEALARQARLELRRLYGQQREAFTWTLPLARGLSPGRS